VADRTRDPKAAGVQAMFDGIAGRYRLMNRLMTFGRDAAWRRTVVEEAALPARGRLLDVASGTGDIAIEALGRSSGLLAVGADFSLEMMRAGKQRAEGAAVSWCAADALDLPFPDGTFDAVTSGYLIRNVTDPDAAFREQLRVLSPGGRAVCLDTSPPPPSAMRPFLLFYLRRIVPLLGRIVSGAGDAYAYLAESTESFKTPGELAAVMEKAGLVDVRYRTFMFGTMAVHGGGRPR